MEKKYPFHYEVRFKFLAFDEFNNFNFQSHSQEIEESNPLIAREKAFSEFEEYLSYIEQRGSIRKNSRGNYEITQPSFIANRIKGLEKPNDYEMIQEWNEKVKSYQEEIAIILVIEDPSVNQQIDSFYDGDNPEEYEIHKVASYQYEEQTIIDNLGLHEMKLYDYYEIDTSKNQKTVYHYGLDYAESDHDVESGAKRIILQTPHIWSSIEEYELEQQLREDQEINRILQSEEDIYKFAISNGESHQVEFKPSLFYNFKTREGGIGVKYVVAKAIGAFLNSSGGILFIGVSDNGIIQGIDYDYSLIKEKNKKDVILLELDSLISQFFGVPIKLYINAKILEIDGKDILLITVKQAKSPVFVKNRKSGTVVKEMFVRLNASSHSLTDPEEMGRITFQVPVFDL